MDKRSGIYEIFNTVNGKRYIGQSAKIKTRFTAHRWHLRRGEHHSQKLQRAWDKHGADAFVFRTVLTCHPTMLTFYEQQLLDKAKPEYNICPIAESCRGAKREPEFGAAISKRMKGNTILLGKKLPADWCAAISAGLTGGKRTDEQRENISRAHIGVRRSDASRLKQSLTMTGQKKSAQHGANISKAKKGIKVGPMSAEQKEKIRAATLAFHARRRAATNES